MEQTVDFLEKKIKKKGKNELIVIKTKQKLL